MRVYITNVRNYNNVCGNNNNNIFIQYIVRKFAD